jgi:hypothetical protein
MAQTINENFESGLPSSAPAVQTDCVLPSGTWSLYNAYRGTNTSYICSDGGSVDMRTLKNGGYAITPLLNNGVGNVSFKEGRGSRTITVQKSTDNGATWSTISTPTSTSCSIISIDVNDAAANRIKIWNASTSDEDIDNISITNAVNSSLIRINPVSLSFGSVIINTISPEQTYSVSATSLNPTDGNLLISAPAGFEISLSSSSGFSSSLNISYSGGIVPVTIIYIHFVPTLTTSYSGVIVNEGGGAVTQNVSLSGYGIETGSVRGFFVSPSGNDANPGTFELPFKTLAKALSVSGPDSLIYLRGGTYLKSSSETISKSGLPGQYIKIWAFPNEIPLYDFSTQTSSDGFSVSGSYIHFKGIEVTHAYHNGINISGHHNIIENCSIHDNRNSGLQMGSSSSTANPSNNLILNCDSYRNYDAPIGGNADGYAIKWNIGSGNIFKSCRAYNNSDDGWDLWMATTPITIDSCIAFRNGVDSWFSGSFDGNGNGFKLGGNNIPTPHTTMNCVSFDNAGNTGRGFDENNNTAGQTVYNCTAYRNKGDNYHFVNTVVSGQHIIKNCISYVGIVNITSGTREKNSWQGFTVSNSDFLSLDTILATLPRNSDGSLTRNDFVRLAAGSSMIDAGVVVGLPYNGSLPDLGAFESGGYVTYTMTLNSINGIVIKNPDQSSYESGSMVQLTASPSTDYHFINWNGDTSSSVNPIWIAMTSNKDITANFALNIYTLSVIASHGSVAKSPDQSSYEYGTSVQLTAVPDEGYLFNAWSGNAAGSTNPISIIIDNDKIVNATFSIKTFIVNATAGLHGSVTPVDSTVVPFGGNQSFVFTPDLNYFVDTVLIDGYMVSDSTQGYTFNNVTSDHSIHVTFGTGSYSIDMKEGWNMISLPAQIFDSRVSAVFPDASSPAFSYDHSYIIRDTLMGGVGYWIKFPNLKNITLTGSPINSDTLDVIAGWNLVGSISVPVPVASIIQIPDSIIVSSFFSYDAIYTVADTLYPAKAYWVKLSASGKLVLSP